MSKANAASLLDYSQLTRKVSDWLYRLSLVVRWPLYAIIGAVVWILIPGIKRICGASSREVWSYSRRSARWGFAVLGIRIESQGASTVKPDGLVVVANHSSWLDQMALAIVLPSPLRFLAKAVYFKHPFTALPMRIYDHFAVGTCKGQRLPPGTEESMIEALNRGETFAFFPEATRAKTKVLLPFKPGAFRLAARAGKPVLPVFILGAGGILSKGASLWRVRRGLIRVIVGEPIRLNTERWESEFQEFERVYKKQYASFYEQFQKEGYA